MWWETLHSRHLKPVLESLSYNMLTVSDQGLLSQNDITIGKAAKTEERMLLNEINSKKMDWERCRERRHNR